MLWRIGRKFSQASASTVKIAEDKIDAFQKVLQASSIKEVVRLSKTSDINIQKTIYLKAASMILRNNPSESRHFEDPEYKEMANSCLKDIKDFRIQEINDIVHWLRMHVSLNHQPFTDKNLADLYERIENMQAKNQSLARPLCALIFNLSRSGIYAPSLTQHLINSLKSNKSNRITDYKQILVSFLTDSRYIDLALLDNLERFSSKSINSLSSTYDILEFLSLYERFCLNYKINPNEILVQNFYEILEKRINCKQLSDFFSVLRLSNDLILQRFHAKMLENLEYHVKEKIHDIGMVGDMLGLIGDKIVKKKELTELIMEKLSKSIGKGEIDALKLINCAMFIRKHELPYRNLLDELLIQAGKSATSMYYLMIFYSMLPVLTQDSMKAIKTINVLFIQVEYFIQNKESLKVLAYFNVLAVLENFKIHNKNSEQVVEIIKKIADCNNTDSDIILRNRINGIFQVLTDGECRELKILGLSTLEKLRFLKKITPEESNSPYFQKNASLLR